MKIQWNTWLSPVDAIKAGLRPNHDRKAFWGDIKKRLTGSWERLHNNRDPYEKGAPDLDNFIAMMAHWGIDDLDDIPWVIRRMYWRIAGAMVWAVVLIYSAFAVDFGLFCIIPVLVAGAFFITATMSALYRITVLKNRRFVLFRDWFWGRV